jgi:hypothetical protein
MSKNIEVSHLGNQHLDATNKEIQCAKCIAYHYYQGGALGVTWLLMVRGAGQVRVKAIKRGTVPMHHHMARGPVWVYDQMMHP